MVSGGVWDDCIVIMEHLSSALDLSLMVRMKSVLLKLCYPVSLVPRLVYSGYY